MTCTVFSLTAARAVDSFISSWIKPCSDYVTIERIRTTQHMGRYIHVCAISKRWSYDVLQGYLSLIICNKSSPCEIDVVTKMWNLQLKLARNVIDQCLAEAARWPRGRAGVGEGRGARLSPATCGVAVPASTLAAASTPHPSRRLSPARQPLS